MKNKEENQIILKELEENEECEIEYKQGKLFLNKKDITNVKIDFFKILKQSILSLQKSLEYQKTELTQFFSKTMLIKNYVKSISYLDTQYQENNHDTRNNGDNYNYSDNIQNNNASDQKMTMIPFESQEVQKSNIFEKIYENILIQQYDSIILMESGRAVNKNTQQLIQNENKKEKREEGLCLKSQDNIIYNFNKAQNQSEMRQLTENQSEIIKFISPLNQRQNKQQIFDLEYELKLYLHYKSISCEQCDQNKLIKINTFLQNIKKVLIFERLDLEIEIDKCCFHLRKQFMKRGKYKFPIKNLEYGDESNLKYHKLSLYISESYSRKALQIKIIQDNYLKYLQFGIEILPFVQIKQKQNQFLSCLTLEYYLDEYHKFQKIQDYLNSIRFSELEIIYYVKDDNFKSIEYFDNVCLVYLKTFDLEFQLQEENEEKIDYQ